MKRQLRNLEREILLGFHSYRIRQYSLLPEPIETHLKPSSWYFSITVVLHFSRAKDTRSGYGIHLPFQSFSYLSVISLYHLLFFSLFVVVFLWPFPLNASACIEGKLCRVICRQFSRQSKLNWICSFASFRWKKCQFVILIAFFV